MENYDKSSYFTIMIILSFIPFTSAFPLINSIIEPFLNHVNIDDRTCSYFFLMIFAEAFSFVISLVFGIFYFSIFISLFILTIPFTTYPIKTYFELLFRQYSKDE